jgi:hypothetical protein
MNQYNNIREKHGYWEKYHSNGNIWHKGNYINSKRISNWEYYNYNDTLINKEFYI